MTMSYFESLNKDKVKLVKEKNKKLNANKIKQAWIWTDEEDQLILDKIAFDNISYEKLSKKLGRSHTSIESRAYSLMKNGYNGVNN